MSIDDPQSTQPYTEAPSEVWPPPPTGQPSFEPLTMLPRFKSMNVLLLIILYVGTLGFYQLYWMKRTIDVVNARCGTVLMTANSLWFLGIIWAVDLASGFMNLPHDTDRLLTLAGNVSCLVVTFMLRTVLEQTLNIEAMGRRTYLNKVWTFFFGLYYLQHRINVFNKSNPYG